MPTKTDEKEIEGVEELQTLPVGDPQASYLSPKPHEGFNVGELPDVEQEHIDGLIDNWQEEAKAAKESEEKALKEREETQAKDAEALRKWQEEQGFIPPVFTPPSEKAATTTKAPSPSS